MVREHGAGDLLRRTDDLAAAAEPALELLAEALEELDVLGLLAGEAEQRAHPTGVGVQLRAGVIEDEGQDELLDQPEEAEVAVAADLVEGPPLVVAQEGQAARPAPAPPAGKACRSRGASSPPMTSSTRQCTRSDAARTAS